MARTARTPPDSIVDPLIDSDLQGRPRRPIVEGDSYLREDASTAPAATADARDADDAYWDEKRGPGPRIMAADTLEGDEVRNEADEKLGELTHIMIDVPTGRVAYAVLSVGGFLNVGDKLFAIPWSALRLDPANHCFRLGVSRQRLEAAQGFDKDAWPSMADQQWAEDLHVYYDAIPYWRRGDR